jgi:adsorption protein B
LFSHLISGLGYLIFVYWFFYNIIILNQPEYPTLQEKLDQSPWVWWMIIFSTLVMVNRLCQRFIAVHKIYGVLPALLVLPRALYGNILNLHSLLRAYRQFFFTVVKKESKRKWDKTQHAFRGAHPILPYKRRLGDLLVEQKIIDQSTLSRILSEHQSTGMQLGELLLQHKLLDTKTLKELLARQHKLNTITKSEIKPLDSFPLESFTRRQRRFLKKELVLLVEFDVERKQLLFAIYDPSNTNLLFEVKNLFKNFTINHLMIIEESENPLLSEG